jgi:hypothetical protein
MKREKLDETGEKEIRTKQKERGEIRRKLRNGVICHYLLHVFTFSPRYKLFIRIL